MPVLDTCKFKEVVIKNSSLYGPDNIFPIISLWEKISADCRSRASNSAENNPTWPKFKLVRDFMPVLDTCKFKEVAIKTQDSMGRTTFPHYKSMGKIFVAQGLVTLQKIIRPDPNSNGSEILCLFWISASLNKM